MMQNKTKELYELLYKHRFSGIAVWEVRKELKLTYYELKELVRNLKEKGLWITTKRSYYDPRSRFDKLRLVSTLKKVDL